MNKIIILLSATVLGCGVAPSHSDFYDDCLVTVEKIIHKRVPMTRTVSAYDGVTVTHYTDDIPFTYVKDESGKEYVFKGVLGEPGEEVIAEFPKNKSSYKD